MKNLYIFILICLSSCGVTKKKSKLLNEKKTVFPITLNLPNNSKYSESLKIDTKETIEVSLNKIKVDIEKTDDYDILVEGEISIREVETLDTFILYPQAIVFDTFLYFTTEYYKDSLIEVSLGYDFFDLAFKRYSFNKIDTFKVKKNESFKYKNFEISLENLNKNPKHSALKKLGEEDLAVGANLKIETNLNGKNFLYKVEPIFVIRKKEGSVNFQSYKISASIEEEGLVFYLTNIDPHKEEITIEIGKYKNDILYPIDINLNKQLNR